MHGEIWAAVLVIIVYVKIVTVNVEHRITDAIKKGTPND